MTVETRREYIDGEFIKNHGCGTPGMHALIIVDDTGTGISQAAMGRIFEPFYTTKEVGKGTGLGLAITYGIIKQHNGFISVSSGPGKGTAFKIYLPMTEEKAEEHKPVKPASSLGGTESILLAEDEADVRNALKAMLEEYGFTVIDAFDGEDAVKKFMENRDVIQLLVFDVVMPRKNGREAYEEINKIHPGIKAIFMSGYVSGVIRADDVVTDGLNFIPKPVSPDDLLKTLRNVLDG